MNSEERTKILEKSSIIVDELAKRSEELIKEMNRLVVEICG